MLKQTAPPHPHPILDALHQASAAVKDVRTVQPTFMPPELKHAAVEQLAALQAQLAELELRLVAAVSEEEAQQAGHRDVAGWLATTTRCDRTEARRTVALAAALDRRWTRVAAGMADGEVNPAQATVIAHALDALPAHLGTETTTDAEETLVGYAAQFQPVELRRLGRRILEVVAPEIADQEEAQRLEHEEHTARDKATLTLKPLGDGLTRITGRLPDADATRLATYLEADTSPRHDPATGGEGDKVPYPRRLAHAFAALLEHLDPARLPVHGGDATTVVVTVTLDALKRDLSTAGILDPHLHHGANLTATQARRLACQAAIIPVVLGGHGEILDLGRTRRLFTPVQRKAIRLRDQRCRAEDCQVKAQWTEIHHLQPWAHGGPTDIGNGISLCNWHHHRIEDPRYEHTRLPNGDIRIIRRT